jgi:hypothetical protein
VSDVALLGVLGRELHIDVGVLREAARRREKQALVLGHRLEQRLDGLQAERRRRTDEIDVVIGSVDVAAGSERIAERACGVLPHRASRAQRQRNAHTKAHYASKVLVHRSSCVRC